MVRNFWNPEEIPSSVPITEEHFQIVGNAWELVMSYKPIWYDVEALATFFTFCANRDSMYKPACDAVDRLYGEIKNEGWNDNRIQRFKNLDALSREIHDTNPDMFVQEM